jgi:hypothetical protein
MATNKNGSSVEELAISFRLTCIPVSVLIAHQSRRSPLHLSVHPPLSLQSRAMSSDSPIELDDRIEDQPMESQTEESQQTQYINSQPGQHKPHEYGHLGRRRGCDSSQTLLAWSSFSQPMTPLLTSMPTPPAALSLLSPSA